MARYFITIYNRSLLAGICIGLGGTINLTLGGVLGAIMFAFGLLAIISFRLPLYTGLAGFVDKDWETWFTLIIVLLGNIFGCILTSFLFQEYSFDTCAIIQERLTHTPTDVFYRSIGCGIIMTLIVHAAREGKNILIFFGIPLFILLGFYHSIAEVFYIAFLKSEMFKIDILNYYLTVVFGNFIGCNIPRCFSYVDD